MNIMMQKNNAVNLSDIYLPFHASNLREFVLDLLRTTLG